MNHILLGVLLAIIIATLLGLSLQEGFSDAPELAFSGLQYDIATGNPSSLSGKPNVGGSTWNQSPFYRADNSSFEPLTFHGHGIPLDYETRRSYKGAKINPNALVNKNPACAPGCCPSTYSCDHGCVCAYNKKHPNM